MKPEVQGGFMARSTSCNKLKAETGFTRLSLDSVGSAVIPWSRGRGRILRKRSDGMSRTILKLAPSSKITPFSPSLVAPHHFSSQISEIMLCLDNQPLVSYTSEYLRWASISHEANFLPRPGPLARSQAEITSAS